MPVIFDENYGERGEYALSQRICMRIEVLELPDRSSTTLKKAVLFPTQFGVYDDRVGLLLEGTGPTKPQMAADHQQSQRLRP